VICVKVVALETDVFDNFDRRLLNHDLNRSICQNGIFQLRTFPQLFQLYTCFNMVLAAFLVTAGLTCTVMAEQAEVTQTSAAVNFMAKL
jgi:hypothetical protein